jgi:hypothetical protein
MLEPDNDLVTGRRRDRNPFPILMGVPGDNMNGDEVLDTGV